MVDHPVDREWASAQSAAAAPSAGDASWPSHRAGLWVVAVLFLAYTFATLDRAILTILVEPIQRDMRINDTQLALLYGFAFVIFYVTLGLPLGYMSDRINRRNMIVACITVWSVMTAACGLAGSYSQLFVARVGVGVGEAGLSPATYSLIADYFPPERRTFALGLYTVALFFGAGAAILFGGMINALVGAQPQIAFPLLGEIRSWQAVFIIIGLPGLVVALLVLTLKEPERKGAIAYCTEDLRLGRQITLLWRHLSRFRKAYVLHFLGFGFLGVPFNVALLWARPYLSRQYQLDLNHAAYWVGGLMMVIASAGIICGSRLADRMQRRGHRDATVRLARCAAVLIVIPMAAFSVMPTLVGALVSLAALLFIGASSFGAAPASLQLITPNNMRALVSACYLLSGNLIGLTVGPTATGVLTDYVFKNPQAIGVSAGIVGVASALVSFIALGLLERSFRSTLEALKDDRVTLSSLLN